MMFGLERCGKIDEWKRYEDGVWGGTVHCQSRAHQKPTNRAFATSDSVAP